MVRGKRGDTLVNIAFIIGMLLIAVVITSVLTRFTAFQGRQLEQNALLDFTAQIKNAVERAQSAPNDADFAIQLDSPLRYTLSVDRGTIRIDFPDHNYGAQAITFGAQTFVIGTTVKDAGTLFVSKRGTTIMVSSSLRCDLDDEVCDPGCILQQVCDPACYQSYLSDVCSPYCVDYDGNGQIDQRDTDGICDPDCYGPDQRGGAYDPDCLRANDDVCDPNTDGVTDLFCDNDCLATNGVCDPDCSAYDVDCPHQDNGFCEVDRGESCTTEGTDCACDENTQTCAGICPGITTSDTGCIAVADMRQEGDACTLSCQCAPGLQCDATYGTNRCCPVGAYYDGTACVPRDGDNICQITDNPPESCESAAGDCACANGGCCPASANADAQGCVSSTLAEGQVCTCDAECSSGLLCAKGACCPDGKEWDDASGSCIDKRKFRLVVVPINYNFPSNRAAYERDAQTFFNHWHRNSPFLSCPNPEERDVLLLLNDNCQAATTNCHNNLCGSSCNNAVIQCARAQYGAEFDKAEGIYFGSADMFVSGGKVLGCAGLSNLGVPPHLGSRWGGAVHEMAQGNSDGSGSTHELGHDWGLCHNRCLSSRPAQCPNNDACDNSAIMAYGPKIYWAPQEASHIRNHPYLQEYLVGCS